MYRRTPERPGGHHFAVRTRYFIVQAEHLGDAVMKPSIVAVERREAPNVHPGQIAGRRAVDDPLRKRAPGSTRGRDADRVEARADEEVREFGGLPEHELVVGGEALRAVVELLDSCIL